jgi:hypothetical protein
MANLLGANVGTNYKGILNLPTLNVGLNTNLQAITDGNGDPSSLSISQTSMAVNTQLFIGNDGPSGWEPAIYSDSPSNVNISVNPDTIVVSNNYSTGSYTVGPSSAIFEMASTTQGMLLPRMTRPERQLISRPEAGLMVYDTTLQVACCYQLLPTAGWYSLSSFVTPV